MSAFFQTSGIQKVIRNLETNARIYSTKGEGGPGKYFKMCGCTSSGLKAFEELIFWKIFRTSLMEIVMGGMSYIFVVA